MFMFIFLKYTATTEIYTLSLHDALPICDRNPPGRVTAGAGVCAVRRYQACRSIVADRVEAAAGVALVLEVVDLDHERARSLHVWHDLHLCHCRDIVWHRLASRNEPDQSFVRRLEPRNAALRLHDRGRNLQTATGLAARESGHRHACAADEGREQDRLQNRASAAVKHVRFLSGQGSTFDHALKQSACPTSHHS